VTSIVKSAKRAIGRRIKSGRPKEPLNTFAAAPTRAPPFDNDAARLFYEHSGRLIHKWDHYLEIYDRFFAPYRGKPAAILEIGVSQGGSIELWRKYFGPSAKIAGVDVEPRSAFTLDENMKIFIGSQADPELLSQALAWLGPPDIVIDDGSHQVRHQHASLDYLFPRMAPRGLYVCEDLHSNYWAKYGGGYRKPSTFIERMKRLVDDLHAWHHRYGEGDKAIAAGQVFGLHFFDSLVVVEKRPTTRPSHIKVGNPVFSSRSK